MPHFLEEIVAQPFACALAGRDQQFAHVLQIELVVGAGDGFRDVELAGEKAVKITRRHAAVGGDLGHGGLGVAEVRKALPGGLEDLLANRILLGHKPDPLRRLRRPACFCCPIQDNIYS